MEILQYIYTRIYLYIFKYIHTYIHTCMHTARNARVGVIHMSAAQPRGITSRVRRSVRPQGVLLAPILRASSSAVRMQGGLEHETTDFVCITEKNGLFNLLHRLCRKGSLSLRSAMSGCRSSWRKSWRLFSSCPNIQERTVGQILDISVPQILENILEVVPIIPQERVQNCTVEQIVDTPTPQIQEER